jgi:hypothetical protein
MKKIMMKLLEYIAALIVMPIIAIWDVLRLISLYIANYFLYLFTFGKCKIVVTKRSNKN